MTGPFRAGLLVLFLGTVNVLAADGQSTAQKVIDDPHPAFDVIEPTPDKKPQVPDFRSNVPQFRAARALLGWSQDQLAEKSGVSKTAIARLELGTTTGEIDEDASKQAKGTLEAAGVIFVEENGEGPSVRIRKASPHADNPKP